MSLLQNIRRRARTHGLHTGHLHLAITSVICAALARFAGATPALLGLAVTAAWLLRKPLFPARSDMSEDSDDVSESFADDIRQEAETVRRRSAMQAMADAIETQLHAQVGKVGDQAQQMREIADEMARIAERSGENIVCSGMAADSSAEASRALADTTNQIETAIACIARQMAEATSTAREAVAAGAEVRASMTQLTGRVGSIASVANRIGDLARQTNLLALNATIEAARAGDSGRGFAVVAAEVKTLARQTASLTSEIAQIIAGIGEVNKDAARTVDQMEQKISSIEQIAAVISEAVDNQREVTTVIAAHVQSNVAAAEELSVRVQNLTQTMLENLDQTAMVHVKSSAIVESTGALEDDLKHTITTVIRTAAPEASRRAHRRYPVSLDRQANLRVRLELDGSTWPSELIDISDGGCSILTMEPVSPGTRGSLSLGGRTMQFRVVTHFTRGKDVIVGAKFTDGLIDAAALLGIDAEAA
jgi:methyl-accepting chemotaxis protein